MNAAQSLSQSLSVATLFAAVICLQAYPRVLNFLPGFPLSVINELSIINIWGSQCIDMGINGLILVQVDRTVL